MKRPTAWRLVALANITLLSLGAIVMACSDDDTSSGTLPGVDGGKSDTGGTTGDSGPGTDAAPAGKPPGCFAGTPSTHLQFLNACTTSDYVLFDNCARIGFCDGGTLPALRDPRPVDAGVDSGTDSGPGIDAAIDAALPLDASTDADDAG